MNSAILLYLAKLPDLIIKCVDIVQLKKAVKDGEKFILYLVDREKNLTQVCENLRNLVKEKEEENAKLRAKIAENK
jgi:tRNA threonylcarbamoyladenosine modification (KEOPS) complex Cgi121 subunit